MKNFIFISLFCVACLLSACEESITVGGAPIDGGATKITKEVFSGYAQKGPFVNGSPVTIFELKSDLTQTGKSFATEIANNSGIFEQRGIELVSNFVQLRVNGFYFNEITGKNSSTQITLTAVADVSDVNTVNVNVLTHLERPRVEYLVQQESKSFADAKKQAQKEILAIFGFSMPEEITFESLDLKESAILLAVSSILQGYFSTSDMAELMANISADIRTDGVLNNTILGSKLISNANFIELGKVRNNVESKYADLGIDIAIPDFENLVKSFINSELYPKTSLFTYPARGAIYELVNILSEEVTIIKYGNACSMTAVVPEGLSLKVVLRGGFWFNTISPSGPVNWSMGGFSGDRQEYYLTKAGGDANDLIVKITNATLFDENVKPYILVDYYEGATTTPTKTKRVYFDDPYGIIEPPCEFTNPLEDLPWLQKKIEECMERSDPDNNIKVTCKIYQCLYYLESYDMGRGTAVGFIVGFSTNNNGVVTQDQFNKLYSCSGRHLSSGTGFGLGVHDSQVLIYESE